MSNCLCLSHYTFTLYRYSGGQLAQWRSFFKYYEEEEIKQRQICDFCLYVITPSMTGVYSIAEAVEDSIKRPNSTVFCYTNYDGKKFSKEQIKSLKQVGIMIEKNGAKSFNDLDDVCMYLNKKSGWKNPFSKYRES